ncbi:hypothetical protein OG339_48600 (plasmid) [Streptosporangium sp. NBC_01495]|uniref:hypothetical protein n=1 Tax=Streptosporangium sp. NBC_01495 TaxID=2903899 RepID=UPI002E2FC9FC|nr:hypothetical protein [Streptosporangium sp. NBC_01495]
MSTDIPQQVPIDPGDHDPELVRAVGDKLNQHWPYLLNDGVQYRVAVDALDGAAQHQDEQAEALANQVMVGQMGPSPEGGWGLTAHVPNEITGALVGWARTMLGDAPNYVEQSFTFTDRQEGERFAITVQRVGNLTPHEARQQAEAERDHLRYILSRAALSVKHDLDSSACRERVAHQEQLSLCQQRPAEHAEDCPACEVLAALHPTT